MTAGIRTCHLRNHPPRLRSRTCHRCSRCTCQNRCSCAAGTSVNCRGSPLNPVHADKRERIMSHNNAYININLQYANVRRRTHLRRLAIGSLALSVFGPFWSVIVGVVAVRAGAAGGRVVLRREQRKNKRSGKHESEFLMSLSTLHHKLIFCCNEQVNSQLTFCLSRLLLLDLLFSLVFLYLFLECL